MKSFDQYLTDNDSFEPSVKAKKLVLKSLKSETQRAIGARDYNSPGFLACDADKYNSYKIAVVFIYFFEIAALLTVFFATAQPIFQFIKLNILVVFVMIDFFIAKYTRGGDNDLNVRLFKKNYLELIQSKLKKHLDEDGLIHIDAGITAMARDINKRLWNARLMLVVLYLLGFFKIAVFYLDLLLDYDNQLAYMQARPAIIQILYVAAPIVYLIIPLLNWKFYGNWIWTAEAESRIKNEIEAHKASINECGRKGFGKITNCTRHNYYTVHFDTIKSGMEDMLGIKAIETIEPDEPEIKDNEYNEINIKNDSLFKTISVKDTSVSNRSRIIKKNDHDVFKVVGVLTDDMLTDIIEQSEYADDKKILLLIIGMQIQIKCSSAVPATLKWADFDKIHN